MGWNKAVGILNAQREYAVLDIDWRIHSFYSIK
jgi:hypothetical protein